MKRFVLPFLLMIFIITSSVTLTLNFRPLYYHDIEALKIEQTSGFSKKVIYKNYNELIDYNSIFHQKPLKLTMRMSEQGRIHFKEVKRIFSVLQFFMILSFIGSLYLGYQQFKRKDYTFFKTTSIITIVFPLITGGIIAMNWGKAFILFHKILFRNDYWLFDEYFDPVIKILPDAFFLHCALLIIFLIMLGSFLCFVFYKFCSSFRHKFMI